MSIQQEKFKAIADRLRAYTVSNDLIKPNDFTEKIDAVLGMGFAIASEFTTYFISDTFWDIYQCKGQRTDYSNAFCGQLFTDERFKPEYPLKVKNAYQMFVRNSVITDLSGIDMDFSECTNLDYTFNAMQFLTKIGDISVVSASVLTRTFMSCTALIEIGDFTVREENVFSNTFSRCNSLEKITFKGTIGNDLKMNNSPLNRASIESIIGCLSGTATGKTLTLKSGQVDKAFETSEGAADGRAVFENIIADKTNWKFSY